MDAVHQVVNQVMADQVNHILADNSNLLHQLGDSLQQQWHAGLDGNLIYHLNPSDLASQISQSLISNLGVTTPMDAVHQVVNQVMADQLNHHIADSGNLLHQLGDTLQQQWHSGTDGSHTHHFNIDFDSGMSNFGSDPGHHHGHDGGFSK
jgi:hypothetical protein